jgi:hypothetical protein
MMKKEGHRERKNEKER